MQDGVANFHLWFLVKLSWFLGFYPGNAWTEGSFFDIQRGQFVLLPPDHRMLLERNEARLLGTLMETSVAELGTIALNRTQRTAFLNALLAFIGYHADTIHAVRSIDILREVF